MVESVIIRHDNRNTLCVSSQVGCAMGCRFCATGTLGLLGNLTCGEILEQLVHANRICPIRNVVFMGMGEPLDNPSGVRRLTAKPSSIHPNKPTVKNLPGTCTRTMITLFFPAFFCFVEFDLGLACRESHDEQ